MGNRDKFEVGDEIMVDNDAFDEQLEHMEEPDKVYVVSETKIVSRNGQWLKVKGGIRMVQRHTDEVRVDTDWLDRMWVTKV